MANLKLLYAFSLLLVNFVVHGAAKCSGYTEVDSWHVVKVHAGMMTYEDARVECSDSVNGKSAADLFLGLTYRLTNIGLQVDTWYMMYGGILFKINNDNTVTYENIKNIYGDTYPFICQCWDTKEKKKDAMAMFHGERKWGRK